MVIGSKHPKADQINDFIFDKIGRFNFRRVNEFQKIFPEEHRSIYEYTKNHILHEKFFSFKYRFLCWWFGYQVNDLICRRSSCNNLVQWTHFIPNKLCSNNCRILDGARIGENLKKSNLATYGVTSTAKLEETKNKFRETCQKKYKVNAPMQSEILKEKFKQSMQKNHGVDWAPQAEDVQTKTKKTFNKKYGVDWPLQSKEIQWKTINTNIKKYGVKKPFQSDAIQWKIITSNIKKYGNIHYLGSDAHKHILPSIIKNSMVTCHPNIKYSNWKNLTAGLIKEKFITNNQLEVKKLREHVGWKTDTSVYRKCRRLGIVWDHSSGGFNPDKEATLYYLYDPQEDLYKIGITNKNASSRFGAGFLRDRKVEILMEESYSSGEQALLAEQEILQAFGNYRTTNPTWPEALGGKTEFFNRNILEL